MSEISRSHVTITLGHGGQVVKRAGLTLDVDIPSFHHAAGTKRSVKDRLGSGEGAGHLSGKRQKTDYDRTSQISSNSLHDIHLGKNDLRFKLMKKKNVLRRFQTDVQHDGMDLREKLSRPNRASLISPSYHERTPNRRDAMYEADTAQFSLNSQSFHEIMPDRRDTRYKFPDTARDSFGSPNFRESMPERRDSRYVVPDTAGTSLDSPCFRESMPDRRDTRYKVPDATRASLTSPNFRESMYERRETRYTVPDAARSSLSSPSFRESMSERRDTRYTVPDAARPSLGSPIFRESMSERGDSRYTVLDASRSSLANPSFRESMPERRDTRYTVRNTARASLASPSLRESMPERRGTRYTVPETRNDNEFGKFSSKRSSDSLYRVETSRNNYSPLRERSPTRDLRGTRNHEDSAKRAPTRTYEVPYTSKDIHLIDPGRPVRSAPYIKRPVVSMTNGKPASTRLSPPPLQMGIIPKSSYLGNEHTSVEGLLKSLGLEKYAVCFKAEEIDIATLKQMGDRDLKDLGIPVGPRTQILLALLPRTQREL